MAAPYLENGGHQGIPYLANQYPGLHFSDFGDAADAFTSQQSILNQNDNSLLNDFWENPEKATADIFPSWPGLDQKVNDAVMGGQMDGLDDSNHIMRGPGVNIGGNTDPLTHNSMGDASGHMLSHRHPATDEVGQGSEDDFKAASGLLGMSLHGQSDSRHLTHSESIPANQWEYYPGVGGFNNVHMQDTTTSPITSSGRQSANSYHSQPQSAYMNNQTPVNLSNQQFMQHYQWMQGNQPSVPQHMPRARPTSLQFDMNTFSYLPTTPQHAQMPNSTAPFGHGRPRPAAPMRFGSDDDFGRAGYRGPHNAISLEEEKQGNLINVPLAAQAAANGHTHMHPHMSYMPQQLQQSHHAVPGSSRHAQNMSAASSPGGHMGGLPLHSPAFNTPMAGTSHHGIMPTQHMEDEEYEDSDEEVASPEEQPRKRRKSHMEREEDGDYHPSSHAKSNASRREAKPSKNIIMQDSDEDYTIPAKSTAGKRRKSSMAGIHPNFGSSNDNSPSSRLSPVAKQTPTSGKKKGRDAEPRKNLTEDQKRKNHIHSEKQRRDLIKVQYDALDSLVPALKGGKSGLSRSDVLLEIVAYVESVADGNAAVDRMIDEMTLRFERANAFRADGNEAV